MKIIGIIAEYNPFHLGHLYQIKEIKKRYPDSLIIAITSTYFTERGDISILNKWDKTNIALNNGIDLVLELPTLYATQSADIFAASALKILNETHIDILAFGTESDNLDNIDKLADIQLNNKEYDTLVKDYLDKGINYPTAMSKALYDISKITINTPNDLLGLSYVKEIKKKNYPISPIAIKRTNDYHSKTVKNNIVNASLIRELFINNKEISNYIPKDTQKYYNKITLNDAYPFLKYNIITNKTNLDKYLDITEGIDSRIIKNINNSSNWLELVKNIKTKRYTYNKINRMLIHILLDIKKENINNDTYIRVLGFTNKGKNYLNKIKKTFTIPFINTYKTNNKALDTELKATYIYSLITNNNDLIKKEIANKPIIIK
jgi:predicted nucleotidyltransferase